MVSEEHAVLEDLRSEETDEGRAAALRDAGLSASADAGMDRFARLVARVMGVPVAMVSLIEPDRQVMPGMVGLGEPWSRTRQAPLTHSLCQQVVFSAQSLVLPDTNDDQRSCGHPAVSDLDVAAYAGMPLIDDEGNVLGSLTAIDTAPHAWSEGQIENLADLAAACSAELRSRILSRRYAYAHALAEDAGKRADQLARQTQNALARSQLLLRAAEDLANTTGLPQVQRTVRELISSDLQPSYVGLVLIEGQQMRRFVDVNESTISAGTGVQQLDERYDLDDSWPAARAARHNTTVVIRGADQLAEHGYGDDAAAAWDSLGLCTAMCAPLPGQDGALGALVIGWDASHAIDLWEQAVVVALAGYTARAVERARFVDHRVGVARQLQHAMLTDLPSIDGLDIAALYRPASGELVGGDWYDAYPLPSAADGGENSARPATVAVSIGDIVGHDVHAATLMGQLRSMLRQADLDHPGAGPAAVVSALEHVNNTLGVDAAGTLIHAHLRPLGAGEWELTWSNAGHPPPLLLRPPGTVDTLIDADSLIYPGLAPPHRTEQRITLPPGSTLLLYTDGLVDRPGSDIETEIANTGALLAERSNVALPALVDLIADTVAAPEPNDDIALLVVRLPG